MLKKLFAAVGVGGATVDTLLDNASAYPGSTLNGQVLIRGGSVDQAIEFVDLVLMTEAEQEVGDSEVRVTKPIAQFRIANALTATAGLERRLPFSLQLPLETPVNNAHALTTPGYAYMPHVKAAVWIHTDLAIAAAVDAKDRDYLDIHPLAPMQRLITAMGNLGFAHTSTDVEIGTARINHVTSTIGCYQEFEFRPMQAGFSRIQEVEISCLPRADGIHVLIETDRRFSRDTYSTLLMDSQWQSVDWEGRLRMILS